MKAKMLTASLFALTAAVVAAYPLTQSSAHGTAEPSPVQPSETVAASVGHHRPKVDVVFVLDTTGSMGGLIQAAKENIWSIANSMASAQPTPEIRVGLVAFRDRGDAYVTQVTDLSGDLDSMYATLMEFRAEGGGDTPESVNQALYDAVHRISWTQDDNAYKVIFLVGDAPAHMDYQGDVMYPETIQVARERGIVVNTILAGNATATASQWQAIASLNQGAFFRVAQSGDAVAVATRFDSEIAELAKELDDTRMFFGDERARGEAQRKAAATDKLHAEASVASLAKRGSFNVSAAGRDNLLGKNDLVEAVTSGRVDLDSIAEDELPEPMKQMDKEEKLRAINEQAEKRRELSSRLADLSRQRQDLIAAELAGREGAEASLDFQIYRAVKDQAAKKGLEYDQAPVH
jgi:Mg-chelatase subunit ChlD